jgi:hypothetical protein
MFYINRETLMDILPLKRFAVFPRTMFSHAYWFRQLRYLHRILENSADKLEQQTAFMETMSRFTMAFGRLVKRLARKRTKGGYAE